MVFGVTTEIVIFIKASFR